MVPLCMSKSVLPEDHVVRAVPMCRLDLYGRDDFFQNFTGPDLIFRPLVCGQQLQRIVPHAWLVAFPSRNQALIEAGERLAGFLRYEVLELGV